MRELTSHKVNGCNEALRVKVLDEPGHGGACHNYVIFVPHDEFNDELNASVVCRIGFQNGPIAEAGTNGVTHEALLAILIDRLEGFQAGPYAHGYNADALKSLRCAQASLQQRTRDRLHRGVEGTHQK